MKHLLGWIGLLMVLVCLAPGVHATSSPKVTVQLIITNAQGAVVAKMTPDGVPTYSADYRPYGTTQSTPQAGPGYTGHVMDPTSELVYMQQRYYDPATGRFISPDPVAPTPGNVFNFGRYTYANDNPIRYTDPNGRCVDGFGCGHMVQTFGGDELAHPGRGLTDPDKAMMALGGAVVVVVGGAEAGAADLVRTVAGVVVRKVVKSDSAKQVEKTVVRRTKSGEKAVRITMKDGSEIDISPRRVKEYVPNTHPKAPKGAMQKVKFEKAQPGSKGFKRDPTPKDLKWLKDAE